MATPSPVWAGGLTKNGTYFEGFVDDLEFILESHKRETVTTWGIRRSNKKKVGSFFCLASYYYILGRYVFSYSYCYVFRSSVLCGTAVVCQLRIALFR